MSKKYRDEWDNISAEDQMAQADLLYELMENDDSNVSDLFDTSYGERKNKNKKKKEKKFNKNGMSASIEKMIVNRAVEDNAIKDSNDGEDLFAQMFKDRDDVNVSDISGWDDEDEKDKNETPVVDMNLVKSESNEKDSIRKIKIITREKFNRGIIDDGVSPFSFNLFPTDDEATINGVYSADDAFDYAYDLFEYMIALRHPTALFKEAEFVEISKKICGYDHTSFVFTAYNGWVYCYYKDAAEEDALFDILTKNQDDNAALLKCCAHIASMAELVPNCIYLEDNDYLNEYYSSELNQKDKFMDIFLNDEYTDYIGDVDSHGSPKTGTFKVIELVSFFGKISAMFGSVVDVNGDTDFDDMGDDGFGDISDEDWNEIEQIAEEENISDADDNTGDADVDEPVQEEPVAEKKAVRMVENTITGDTNKKEVAKEEVAVKVEPADKATEPEEDDSDEVDSNDLISDDMEIVTPDSDDQSMVINTHMKPSTR